jgi:hypothetical protein
LQTFCYPPLILRLNPRDVTGKCAVKNCGGACTEWNYNTIGSDWRLALSKGPNRVGVSLPSPENGNRSSFQNLDFSSI